MATRPRPTNDQRFAWQVQDILVGCGLSQTGSSIASGPSIYIPKVISVVDGPPKGLIIRILPGQMPDHFAAQARTIAYNLGMADVEVVGLGPYLIRLELVPKPAPRSQSGSG